VTPIEPGMLAEARDALAAIDTLVLLPLATVALVAVVGLAYLWRRGIAGATKEGGTLAGQVMAANVREELATERAAAAEQRLGRVFAAAPFGMALIDSRGCITRVNPALSRLLHADDLAGGQLVDLVGPDDRPEVLALLGASTDGAAGVELQIGRPGGTIVWGRLSIMPLGGEDGGLLVHVADASEQRDAEVRLEHLATHDPVTGLPNRQLFHARAATALRQGNRTGCYVGCLFVDLDNFRALNDSLGHAVGDRVLTHAAIRLSETIRPDDTVARMGDDEFCLLLVGLEHQAEAEIVAQRVRRALDGFLDLDGLQVATSASVGVAVARPGDRSTPETLVRDADTALCRAQADGLSRPVVFGPELREDVLRHLPTVASP